MPCDNNLNSLPTRREAGVVLHISSLPGPFGIGEIGAHAHAFVNSIRRMNMSLWQFLPLGPTAYGDSPYQPLSSFAGNEMLIDIQDLIARGLLRDDEVPGLRALPTEFVDYGALIPMKSGLLTLACERFESIANEQQRADRRQFIAKHDRNWLHDYALFRVLKSQHDERPWPQWESRYAHRNQDALQQFDREHAQQIAAVKTAQYLFFEQWLALREYANSAGIRLFADMPIYIALDSSDAWARRELLQIDNDGHPSFVAGVPPDYFSEDGQLWGNPLYDWEQHAATGFEWWVERLRASIELADIVRIDHFRGFESYWSIPADSDSARTGNWESGPSDALFNALEDALGTLPIVAEDLGLITPEVDALRDRHELPGMAVLQFVVCNHDFNPECISHNRVCYTGTHDNDTTLGWYRGGPYGPRSDDEIRATQEIVLQRTGGSEETVSIDMIKIAFSTPACIAIAPIQDILGLDSSGRMNTPGTTENNWRWRMQSEQLSPELCDNIANLVHVTARGQ
jgi:4-alpha-glucanotransferase